MLVNKKFGAASSSVVIEEFLTGEEFSLMAFVNGDVVIPLEIAQDHKRAYDGDKGPNTGGMGAYSPVPHIAKKSIESAIETILKPAARALVKKGRTFAGFYMPGDRNISGPKVIEFNARFGDPETQVILPRLKSDLVLTILELLDGGTPELVWDEQAMAGVVVAAKGYPESYEKGAMLKGLADFSEDVAVFHAGTSKNQFGEYTVAGGRVLLVGAMAEDLQTARGKVYQELEKLQCNGVFYRKDIGAKAIEHIHS